MADTKAPPQRIKPDTRMRFKRNAVFQRASQKGANNHDERMQLMNLSRATYFRLLRGTNVLLDTATRAANALDFTVDEAFEPVA